jgi:hypothetical protein
MLFDEYRQLPGINASSIKRGAISMKHMHAEMTRTVDIETPAMRWGRLVHKAVLEPVAFAECAVVFTSRRAGGAWEEFAAQHAPEWIIKDDEKTELEAIIKAVHANTAAHELIEAAQKEVTLTWCMDACMDAIKCKARLDGYHPDIGIVELKTTSRIDPGAFGRQFVGMGYDLQCGWYSDGALNVFGGEAPVVTVIAVESDPPYDVAVYTVPRLALTIGAKRAREIARRYAQATIAGIFDGVSNGVTELLLPEYYGADEMEAMFANGAAKLMEG